MKIKKEHNLDYCIGIMFDGNRDFFTSKYHLTDDNISKTNTPFLFDNKREFMVWDNSGKSIFFKRCNHHYIIVMMELTENKAHNMRGHYSVCAYDTRNNPPIGIYPKECENNVRIEAFAVAGGYVNNLEKKLT